MTATRARLALALAPCVALVGCLAGEVDRPLELRLSLGVPRVAAGAAGEPGAYWDGAGQFYLERFPKYVRVTALDRRADIALAAGSWPDPVRGIGPLGEAAQGEVRVAMAVPVVPALTLQAVGFFRDKVQGQVLAYGGAVELDASRLLDGEAVDLELERLERGTIDLTVRCLQGNTSPWQPARVQLVDARARLVYPPVELVANSVGSLKAKRSVPVGRPLWARVELKNVASGGGMSLDVRRPTVRVEQPNELKPLMLALPCP